MLAGLRHPSICKGCQAIDRADQADQAKLAKSPVVSQPSRVGRDPITNSFSLQKEKVSGLSSLSGLDSCNDCGAGLLGVVVSDSLTSQARSVARSVRPRVPSGAYGSPRRRGGWVCGLPMQSLHRFGTDRGENACVDQCSSQCRRSAVLSSGGRFS